MAIIACLLILAVTMVTSSPFEPIEGIHPQCLYTECPRITYVEQLDTNIYKVLVHPLNRVRIAVSTCEPSEIAMLACSDIMDYLLDNGIKRTRPLQILYTENEPKPSECLNDDDDSDSDADEKNPSFPCCAYKHAYQLILPGDLLNPPQPHEGSGVEILPLPEVGLYNIIFNDSLDENNIMAKYEELKNFLSSQGLVYDPDHFNVADFSFPGAPDINRYWVMVAAHA